MRPVRIVGVVLAGAAAAALGCTWVPLTPEGSTVRVLPASETAECERINTVNTRTTDRVSIFARSDRKVREELESLARNEAADAGGNAVAPVGPMAGGRQSFVVYRCP